MKSGHKMTQKRAEKELSCLAGIPVRIRRNRREIVAEKQENNRWIEIARKEVCGCRATTWEYTCLIRQLKENVSVPTSCTL